MKINIKRNFIQLCLLCAVVLQAATSKAQPVTKIAAGAIHNLFVKSDGSLWAMGNNEFGQLGDGTYNNTNRPEQIVATGITAIAAGDLHSLFLKGDGSMWGMGYNEYGQLGNGNEITNAPYGTNWPVLIVTSNVIAIAAGYVHSVFLKNDGSLWAMGFNSHGELGDGTYNNTSRPKQIVSSNVTAIAAGRYHSLFIKNNGSLWAMGQQNFGQLGDGMWSDYDTGTNQPEQIVSSNVTAIAAGYDHSLFLKSDGSLWAMGGNWNSSLGNGESTATNRPQQIVASNVTAIAAGHFHNLFLKSDGSLWAFGFNIYGQLGDGSYNDTNRPEQIMIGGVAAIAACGGSLLLKLDGSLWGMGQNVYGQLGDGSYSTNEPYGTNRPTQIIALSPPALGISTYGNMPTVFFPTATGTNYVLQMTTNLASGNWISVTNGIPMSGLQITNAPGAAFFRLH